MSECTEKLKINPALRLLVLPLSTAEYTALETDILTNGSQKPVQCWHSSFPGRCARSPIGCS